ncbi:hypothetical protein Mycsm_01258 [Mycobacterium sp. JS623]|uniref:hypothetical protein n=1 Tax=Mycobacterium sp. JS623 TaxID=212767 RepID=UPI0002A587A0|nr:hypothetical protein [Mycobacterium sp. JS623]AGB21675.1 hypothetical protein Mycsm_01258 [Mycobacterium sp. JS623]
MTALVQRKLPGTPIPRDQLIAQWEDLRRRNSVKGPVASFLFDVHYSEPEKTYQWRIQLDCGCVRDALTRHHTDKPADKVERLGELTQTYYFGHVKPSEREIRDAEERANTHAVEAARAKVVGTDLPAKPEQPGIYGKARLQDGQFMCHNPKCTKYRSHGGPVRDIVDWVRLRDNLYVSEQLEIDDETIRGAREYAVWDVVLSCGHFEQEHTAPGWNPKDGPAHRNNDKRRPLDEVLEVLAKGDPDEEAYWRRMYAEKHPDPAPFTRCHACACIRTITAYQRVGWLANKRAVPKPTPPPRKTLERRLRKLETEAAELREQIEGLPPEA